MIEEINTTPIVFAFCEIKNIANDTNSIANKEFCISHPYTIAEIISNNSDLPINNDYTTTEIYPHAEAISNTQLDPLNTQLDPSNTQLDPSNTRLDQSIDDFINNNDDITDCEPVHLLHVDCENIYDDHNINGDFNNVDDNVNNIDDKIVNLTELGNLFDNDININDMIFEIYRQLYIRYEDKKTSFKMHINSKMKNECDNIRNKYIQVV